MYISICISYVIINRHIGTHVSTKYYNIFAKPTSHLSCLSNPVPYPEYFYLSTLAFLVILTAPNKEFSSVE